MGRKPTRTLRKKERLMVSRQRKKMEKQLLGGICRPLSRLPAATFHSGHQKKISQLLKPQKLGIPVFALVDTNFQPK